MNPRNLNLIKETIEKEVFITDKDSFIYSGSSLGDSWIFDFRKVLLEPQILNAYTELFFEKFEHLYPFQVGGIETASIPLISAIVMKSVERKTPVNGFFIRKSRKKDGLLNMIEGEVKDIPVILVDDLINSGGSFIRQVEVIEQYKKELKILSIFTILKYRDNKHYQYFIDKNISIDCLFELNNFIQTLPLTIKKELGLKKTVDNRMEVLWYWKGSSPSYEYVLPKSAPLFYKNKLYFGTDSGLFVCLNSQNGEIIWKYQVPVISKRRVEFSNPCTNSNLIYFGSNDGNFYAFNADTGKREWINFDGDWIESSPAVSEELNLVYVNLQFGYFNKQSKLCALNAKTGNIVWKFELPKKSLLISPVYSQKYNKVIVCSDTGDIYAINAKNGTLLWKNEFVGRALGYPSLDENRGIIAVCGNPLDTTLDEKASLIVLDINIGKPILEFNDFYYGSFGVPLFYRNTIIFTSLDKHIYSIDIETGKRKWIVDTGARVFSTPSIFLNNGQERIYVGSNNAVLYEIEPETGVITSMTYLTERITSKVACDLDAKTIFVPTYANEVYALKRKLS